MLRTWIIYGILLVGSAIYNRLYPGYISSLSFYIIFFVPVISLIHMVTSYFVFVLSHRLDKNQVAKGEKITYTIKLINPTFILLVPYALHYVASDRLFVEAKDDDKKPIIINPRSLITLRKELTCHYRGTYSIGVDKIILRDFFGFFRISYSEIEQHKILVYPKLRELKSNLLKNVINESSESVISNDTQNMSVFTDVRDYQPGDPLNRIHWKLTAKAGNFISKDYSGQMTNKTKVFLDTFSLNLDEEDTIIFEDYLVEGCVSLIHFLLENRIHTNLYFEKFGVNAFEGLSSNDFPKFYDELAKLSFYRDNKFAQSINETLMIERDTCHIVVITQNMTNALLETLIKLKNRNFEVSVIVCDLKALGVSSITGYGEHSVQYRLATAKIPVYFMQHNENSTVLGVS